MTRLFATIFPSATEETTTIAVAAENPPRKTSRLIARFPASIGMARMNLSPAAAGRPRSSPPNAIGMMKRLMRSRYSGNIHIAVLMWDSSPFCTTNTWNWRGSRKTSITAMAK